MPEDLSQKIVVLKNKINSIQSTTFEVDSEQIPKHMSLVEILNSFKIKMQDQNQFNSIQFRYTIDNQSIERILASFLETKPRMDFFTDRYYDTENNDLLKNNLWFRRRLYMGQINLREESSDNIMHSLKLVEHSNGFLVKEKTDKELKKMFLKEQVDMNKMFSKHVATFNVNRIYLLDEFGKYSVYLDQCDFQKGYYVVIGFKFGLEFISELINRVESFPIVSHQPAHNKLIVSLWGRLAPHEFLTIWKSLYSERKFNNPTLFEDTVIPLHVLRMIKLGYFIYVDENFDSDDDDEEIDEDDDEEIDDDDEEIDGEKFE